MVSLVGVVIRRPRITLLEILITIAILATVGTIVSMNITKLVREQNFKSEVAITVSTLQLAQQLMFILDTDVIVKFSRGPENKGIEISMEMDEKTEKNKRRLLRKKRTLSAIHVINFQDALGENSNPNTLNVRFMSGGSVMSQGIMRLSTNENPDALGALNSYICLPGFPHYFQADSLPDKDPTCDMAKESAYDKSLSQSIQGDILNKMRMHTEEEEEKKQDKDANQKQKPNAAPQPQSATAPKKK